MTPFVKKLVDAAEDEWVRWGGSVWPLGQSPKIAGEETDDGLWQVVAEYWRASDPKSKGHGRDGVPWSGAFIVFCFKKAGAGANFPYSSNHSAYLALVDGGGSPSFSVSDPATVPVEVGDLVWNPRTGKKCRTPPFTFAAAVGELGKIRSKKASTFCSHCDIVVDVRPNRVVTVGGNMGQSVRKTTWVADKNGSIIDGRENWIGVVKNGL